MIDRCGFLQATSTAGLPFAAHGCGASGEAAPMSEKARRRLAPDQVPALRRAGNERFA